MGVIGPNGAGKSTLARLLCGQLKPTSGSILIDGKPLPAFRERRHIVGLVPQNIGLYPHLSGTENLEVFAKLFRLPRSERVAAIDRSLRLVEMTPRAHVRVEEMSGGMQRRINVAVATLMSPPVIVFDEPTAGVDQPARDVIHHLAKRLSEQGHVVCLVTHELEQAERLCDSIVLLEKGRLHAFGTPSEILDRAFGTRHEVLLRLRSAPTADIHGKLDALGFTQLDAAPTAYSAQSTDGNPNFVARLMQALGDGRHRVREVTVRRPGLDVLMSGMSSQ